MPKAKTAAASAALVLVLPLALAVPAFLAAPGLLPTTNAESPAPAPDEDPALARARAQVRMLDDLYKTAVVSINQTYQGPPAAKIAKAVFKAMEEKGHHSARLVDATGEPLNEANAPRSDFEKRAAKAMLAGEAYLDQVVEREGARRLLAATLVPAVDKKCAECHGVEVGTVLGFIRYDLPVE